MTKKKAGNVTALSESINKNAETISEEQNENDAGGALNNNDSDIIVDPDVRVIEDFNMSTADEESKWDNILDVSDILQKKDLGHPYIMACKVLGIVPVSSMVDALASSEIRLAHRGIGAKGAEALAKALEVK